MCDRKDKNGKNTGGRGRKPEDLPAEDRAIWHFVTRTVTPYAAPSGPAPRFVSASRRVKVEKNRPAVQDRLRDAPPQPAGALGIDGATARKMRRGQLEIEARLDLHGSGREDALIALRRFISAAVRDGKRNILVVTGKGGRAGTGVLRQSLPRWLEEEADLRSVVLAFRPALPKDGGTGAWYIRLRRVRG